MATKAAHSNTSSPLPRDARLIALLLAANGIEDCDEGVVRMLVEFAHRQFSSPSPHCVLERLMHSDEGYTSDVLTDSLVYAEHARTGQATSSSAGSANTLTPSMDDVRLAVQARTEGASVPKELLLQLASQVNSMPLPSVPEVYGIRLPQPAQRLTAPNFSLVKPVPKTAATTTTTEQNGTTAENDEEDDEEEDDDEDEDDEEMEDVTLGLTVPAASSSAQGAKRKAGASDDEEYD